MTDLISFTEAVYEFYRLSDEFNRLLVQGTYDQCIEARDYRDQAYEYAVKLNGGTNQFPN